MARGISLVRNIAAAVVLVLLAACAATYANHGYVPADSELAQVKIGASKADVQKTIGPPTVEGLMKDDGWYYVQSRWRFFGAFKPKEVDRQVVAISFDKAGRVVNIERFGLDRGHVVEISRRVTTSTVKSIGLLQQLFNDIGRFDASQFLKRN